MTSRRISVDGNLLDKEEPMYMLNSQEPLPAIAEGDRVDVNALPFTDVGNEEVLAAFMNDKRDPMEGD